MRQETRQAMLVPVLAWGLCGLYVLGWLATVALFASSDGPSPDIPDLVVSGLTVGYALVGALVAIREPRNAVGWLLLAVATTFGISGIVEAYVVDLDRPLIAAVTWLGVVVGDMWVVLAALVLPLVFPDGRLLSRRWRPVLWVGVAAMVLSGVEMVFTPGPLDDSVADSQPPGCHRHGRDRGGGGRNHLRRGWSSWQPSSASSPSRSGCAGRAGDGGNRSSGSGTWRSWPSEDSCFPVSSPSPQRSRANGASPLGPRWSRAWAGCALHCS